MDLDEQILQKAHQEILETVLLCLLNHSRHQVRSAGADVLEIKSFAVGGSLCSVAPWICEK